MGSLYIINRFSFVSVTSPGLSFIIMIILSGLNEVILVFINIINGLSASDLTNECLSHLTINKLVDKGCMGIINRNK